MVLKRVIIVRGGNAFWTYLFDEGCRAKTSGNCYVFQGDLKAWMGPKLIKGELRPQNRNGKLLAEFVKENNLTCVNSLELTEGVVTRIKNVLGKKQQSTIDFYVVCECVLQFVTSMKIENGRKHTQKNFSAGKKGGEFVESDHKPLVMEVKIDIPSQTKEKQDQGDLCRSPEVCL